MPGCRYYPICDFSKIFMPKTERYLNRELSWLEFNSRVLQLAEDSSVPLLERVRFLGIFGTNLDDFFMKRVGAIRRHIALDIPYTSLDGLDPRAQLEAVRESVIPLTKRARKILNNNLLPGLSEAGVSFVKWNELLKKEKKIASEHFYNEFFPLLTPLAVDSAHPFPLISNLSVSLGVVLMPPESDELHFSRVKISGLSTQWLQLPAEHGEFRFISAQEIVEHHIDELFPKMQIISTLPFRITRNVDIEIDEEQAEDLRGLIEDELRLQRFARVVRLQHGPKPDKEIIEFLQDHLNLVSADIYQVGEILDYSTLSVLHKLPLPKLTYPSWTPATPAALPEEGSMFTCIKSRDILVHHPYESFALSVERFVREAAEDPEVRSIKMTVYRVGEETQLIPLLIKAANSGKQVICVVELQARLDEEKNLNIAARLEEAGVHVIHGLPGLKVHAKTLLVTREDHRQVTCYAHIGTGNYHSRTATQYTDFGLFTCDNAITTEIIHLFNYLTGHSLKDDYKETLIAPLTMEKKLLEYVEKEVQEAKAGRPAYIIAKMNGLEDKHIIDALYKASKAGVKIDLIVRGVCCLRPGVKGLSERIRVISILGRLLEHSRVFYFQNKALDPTDGVFYISSADWMDRNLHRRVELAVPIKDPALRQRVWQSLQVMLQDNEQAWEMQPDGSYKLLKSSDKEVSIATQETLFELAKGIPGAQ